MTTDVKEKYRQLSLRNNPKEIDNIPFRFAMGYIWHYDAVKDAVIKELWENAYENSRVTVVKRDKGQLTLRGLTLPKNARYFFKKLNNDWVIERKQISFYRSIIGDLFFQDNIDGHYPMLYTMFFKSLEENDTYEDMKAKLNKTIETYIEVYEKRADNFINNIKPYSENGLDRFVTKIEKPMFIRVPENTNKKTFDIIKVIVGTCVEWPNRNKFIKENAKDIYKMVLKKLEDDKSYQKFNVPIGCLALTELKERYDHTLDFTFELKKELR